MRSMASQSSKTARKFVLEPYVLAPIRFHRRDHKHECYLIAEG